MSANLTFTSHETLAGAEDELRDHLQEVVGGDVPDDHFDVNAMVEDFYLDGGLWFVPKKPVVSKADFFDLALYSRWS